MKINYSYLLSFILISAFAQAQIFQANDLNTLTLGNVNTNIDFSAAGQGGFFTFADNGAAPTTTTNAANSNFQIVAGGENNSRGLEITGPNGDKGFRQIQQPGFTWSSRTTGNDIVEAEFSFNTGANNTSENLFRFLLRDDGSATTNRRTMVGIQFDSSTRELRGLATLNNAGMEGLFGFDLGTGGSAPLILTANTWVRVGMSYNTTTGEIRWKSDYQNLDASFSASTNVIANQTPADFIMIAFAPATNTAARSLVIDNTEVRAVATDMLLGLEDGVVASKFQLYPNPVHHLFQISSDGADQASSVEVYDMSGKQVLSQKLNAGTETIDSSSLTPGVYVAKVSSVSGATQTLKLIKN